MKRELYTIADEEFVTLLDRAQKVFASNAIPYMLVGGAATQAHIANYLCRKTGQPLLDFVDSPDTRIQDHLRATDDIDATLDPRKESDPTKFSQKILSIIKEI